MNSGAIGVDLRFAASVDARYQTRRAMGVDLPSRSWKSPKLEQPESPRWAAGCCFILVGIRDNACEFVDRLMKRFSSGWGLCRRLTLIVSAVATLCGLSVGQEVAPAQNSTPLPTDWSHSHLIFSQPKSAEQLAGIGENPRYWQQLERRRQLLTASPTLSQVSADSFSETGGRQRIKRDWSVDLGSGATTGAGNYPAKFSFHGTTANCATAVSPDFVVYSTELAGSSTQANVVAFDNLYSGCSGTVPLIYWAYNTGGQILTSPVISQDGSQIAFVETNGGFGILVLLKWAPSNGTIGSPSTLVPVAPSLYRACSAPCMTEVLLRDGSGVHTDDTTSSVFYDYSHDIGWVGGARGWLHKIPGMFKGIPTEVTTGAFPVQLNSGNPTTLSSPVYDGSSGIVFVGDAGGFLYAVDSTTAAVTTSAQLDFGTGIVEGPIVDSTNGLVYVFASSDGSTLCTIGTSACAAVYQLSTAFSEGDSGTEATAGTSVAFGLTPNPMYIGGFDNAYYSSVTATGNLYVCGNTGQNPAIYQIPIRAGAPTNGTAVVGLTSASFSPACSPVADVLNPNLSGGAAERLYVSVQSHGVATGCAAGGCLMNFIDTPWAASTQYQLGQQILDSHLNIEQVTVAGTSGFSVSFSSTAGSLKTDGSVHWVNQGALSAAPLPTWTGLTAQSKLGSRIVDSRGNIEAVTKTGTTGISAPSWNATVGATTTDGGVTWINSGASTIAVLPVAGGASGIVIDNTLNGALAGTSQIYFTTLSDQTCGTTGAGGCAVQASQPQLN